MTEVIPKIHRPDQNRIIKVSGPLTVAAARRLGVALRQLAKTSTEPITLNIHSSGGEAEAFYQLMGVLDTLRVGDKKCRVFTLARRANSAAAYLLLAGYRAYALPDASIGLHGTRGSWPKDRKHLSREKALALAMRLDRENRSVARILAKRVVYRLADRQQKVGSLNHKKPPLSPQTMLKNLTRKLSAQLASDRSRRMLHESFERCELVLALSPEFPTQIRPASPRILAEGEARIFQAAIAFELKAHRGSNWRLDGITGAELLMDYLLAKDFLPGDHLKFVRRLARRFGPNYLSKPASARYEKLKQRSLARADNFLINTTLPGVLGLWYFSMTLCHRLLTGEHRFTAQDAYWLGLIDEVLPAPLLDGSGRAC